MKHKLFAIIMAFSVALFAGCTPAQPADETPEMMDEDQDTVVMETQDEQEEEVEETDMEVAYTDITVEEASTLIDENPELIIIDVSPNYENGHLPGSINYYVGDGSLDDAIPELDPEAMYLVYCHVETASRLGAQKLVDAGFENVYRLDGDYPAWVEAGYPIEE